MKSVHTPSFSNIAERPTQRLPLRQRDPSFPPDNAPSPTQGWMLFPQRLFLGGTFVYAGLQKLTDLSNFFQKANSDYIGNQIIGFAQGSPLHLFLIKIVLPHAVLFGWTVALGELAIGLATLFGLLFRPAAFFGMVLSLLFFLTASWNVYPYFYGADIVFALSWLTLFLIGPTGTGLPTCDLWLQQVFFPSGSVPERADRTHPGGADPGQEHLAHAEPGIPQGNHRTNVSPLSGSVARSVAPSCKGWWSGA